MTSDDVTPHGNGKDIVRAGYDAVSYRYRGDHDDPAEYQDWIDTLTSRLPVGATVLDIGCGCGVPVARDLTAAGLRVTGIDISDVQIERARSLVPEATFIRADATRAVFAPSSFDAVVSFYALIHMPQDDQRTLISRAATWLRPGGWLLTTTGATGWTGIEAGWLGGEKPMWWSHPDAATYRSWITDAALTIEAEDFIPEGSSGHQMFRARRPDPGTAPGRSAS